MNCWKAKWSGKPYANQQPSPMDWEGSENSGA